MHDISKFPSTQALIKRLSNSVFENYSQTFLAPDNDKHLEDIVADAMAKLLNTYVEDVLNKAQSKLYDINFPGHLLVLQLYRAFGWQSGTIQKILKEIENMRAEREYILPRLERLEDENSLLKAKLKNFEMI